MMPKYRIYRTFEMYGYQDVEAANEQDALDRVAGDDDPEYWQMNGYGDSTPPGGRLEVYSVDGKRV